MRIGIVVLILGCALLSACSTMSYTAISPVYTASDAFLIDTDPTLLHPHVVAHIWFGGTLDAHGRPVPCMPASVADYQAHPDEWRGAAMQRRCDGRKLTLLPVGTAIVVDTAERSWDFENGTGYYISGHLLDPGFSQHQIILGHPYFVFPSDGSRDAAVKPNPIYFTTQAPGAPQP